MSEIALQTFNLARSGKQGCLFCDPFPIMHVNNTENFNLLADTFPVISGHLMISSKEHYGCAGELPEELQVELIKMKNSIAATIRKNGNQVIFYEHGRAGCCLANNPDGSKCEHFHLHVLPVAVDITQHLDQSFTKIKMKDYKEIFENYYAYGNYLFFENALGESFFYPAADSKVDSHLLRTLICKELNVLERSDWQRYTEASLWVESLEVINKLVA